MKTALTERLGLTYPILSAPLGRGSTAAYLGALAAEGAMGFVALMHMDEGEVAQNLSPIIAATEGRFGVNLTLVVDQRERLRTALDMGVRVVSLWQGDPAPYIATAKRAGATVFWTVGTPQDAARARELGVDFIVCQGREAGGHLVGSAPLMALLPAVVDAANGVPVIAAGGIADGRGLAAALALGAEGVWLGTRFVMSRESGVHPGYKESVAAAGFADLVETTLFDGGWPDSPHRVVRNATVAAWEAAGCPRAGERPGEGDVVTTLPDGRALRRYNVSTPWDGMGDGWAFAPFYAGASAALIDEVKPVAAILREMMDTARAAIARSAARASTS